MRGDPVHYNRDVLYKYYANRMFLSPTIFQELGNRFQILPTTSK